MTGERCDRRARVAVSVGKWSLGRGGLLTVDVCRPTGRTGVSLRLRRAMALAFPLRHRRLLVAGIVAALGATGCDGPSPASPSGSTSTEPPPNRVIDEIRVTVSDTAFRRVPDARVTITGGTGVGTSVTTDSMGRAALSGAFSGILELETSKDGFLTLSRRFAIGGLLCGSCLPRFNLSSPDPVVALEAGRYAVTFMADPSCTAVPEPLRTRTYAAQSEACGPVTTQARSRSTSPGCCSITAGSSSASAVLYVATEDGGSSDALRAGSDRHLSRHRFCGR